ncbi:PPOX class probable F420-dependent enzyme [Herbihabitans rhizosphaerae]|uniref:PPOX class probable F420-dependent enzyme n=1 Tax=Herbihabitans rhizosphaerae TaxID=1872711 RepID=A0A4Q7KHE6_9PSEU|nr:PPOX class F420-dependent oxidoreductase [Herbihabitans rhizosphaerae]RZS34693.1 PPOX class probable F420-dependent enzyme [Herbihabitans rhizosphaerae]
MTQLADKVRKLFDDKNFAVLSTLEPDGKTHSTVVWVKRDGDELLFALPKSRRKIANMNRDPRVTVAIFDAANPYDSVQVQGTASVEDDPDGILIDELSHKYTGGPYPGFAGPNPQWVIARIRADKVSTSWPDS